MPISVALRRLARLACLTAVAAGCYWSVRLTWADHLFRRDTETTVALAVELAPGNAEYHARLAALHQDAGRDAAAIEVELRAAAKANPRMSSAWIHLGLRAETAGDMAQAEADLARAVQADHTYATLWTLANFYFRRNDPDRFWPVARRALRIGDVTAHDPAPLFRLCWKLSQNPATVLERAIPDVGAVQSRYLAFLVRENLAQVAEPVTQRVVAFGGERDLDSVLDYCDRLIAAGDAEHAIHAWNALCWRTLHSYLMEDEPVQSGSVEWVTGAVLVARRAAMEVVGLLDEGYFLYWEDMDWCYRMRRAGWGVFVVPEARAIHLHRREGVRRPFSRASRAQVLGAVRFFRKFGWNPGKVT